MCLNCAKCKELNLPCNPLSCVCGKKCYLPLRYVATILAFFCIVVGYGQRVCINIVITTMVVKSRKHNPECPSHYGNETKDPIGGGKQVWSETQQQIILASFFLGYCLLQIPAGIISDKLGARIALGFGILISTIITGIFSVVVVYTPWPCVVVLRILLGVAQGVIYPGVSTLYAHWIPKEERSSIGSLSFAANAMGVLFGNLVSGFCVHVARDWTAAYYLWTIVGVIWCIFFFLYVYAEPELHPHITEKELERLQETIHHFSHSLKIPWKKLLTCKAVWAILIAQLGHDYTIYTLMTNIPKYLSDVLNYDIKDNAMITSFPFFMQWLGSIIAGRICDYLNTKKHVSLLLLRNICTFIGLTVPAAVLIVAAYMNCDGVAVGICFGISLCIKGAFYAGAKVNHLDLAVNFAGMIMAVTNACGALMGFIGPYVVLGIAHDNTLCQWKYVFWFIFGFSCLTNIFYAIFAKAHRMKWDVPDFEMEEWLKERDEHVAHLAAKKAEHEEKERLAKEQKEIKKRQKQEEKENAKRQKQEEQEKAKRQKQEEQEKAKRQKEEEQAKAK